MILGYIVHRKKQKYHVNVHCDLTMGELYIYIILFYIMHLVEYIEI